MYRFMLHKLFQSIVDNGNTIKPYENLKLLLNNDIIKKIDLLVKEVKENTESVYYIKDNGAIYSMYTQFLEEKFPEVEKKFAKDKSLAYGTIVSIYGEGNHLRKQDEKLYVIERDGEYYIIGERGIGKKNSINIEIEDEFIKKALKIIQNG